jgi:hypothetical protein
MAFVRTTRSFFRGSLRVPAIALAILSLVLPGAARAATVYVGSWTNTTFGSSGAASFVVDIAGADVSFTADLDGMVFGVGDPPAVTLTGTITGDVATVAVLDHPTYGDMTGTFDLVTGAVEGLISDLPLTFIDRASISGTGSPTAIALNYVVCFTAACATEGVDRAVGVINATVIPLPATAWLFAAGLACAGLRLRRRRGP